MSDVEVTVEDSLAIYLHHIVSSVQAQHSVPDDAWVEILGDDFGSTARIAFATLWAIHLDACEDCKTIAKETVGEN